MANRLRLDFQIDSAEERVQFLQEYLNSSNFQLVPLDADELETCANYILWGKDAEGKNSVQRKEVQIKTRYGTWDAHEDESLDALVESPTFSEARLFQNAQTRYKATQEVFSREKAFQQAPPQMVPVFEKLFAQIDRLELLLNFYDLAHNKRKKPPRPELLNKFSEEDAAVLRDEADTLNQFTYLKLRHLLVELRRQQYTLSDAYTVTIQRHTPPLPILENAAAEIRILPAGLYSKENPIFQWPLRPTDLTEDEIQRAVHQLWKMREQPMNRFTFDFRNIEHVYNLILQYGQLYDGSLIEGIENDLPALLRTFEFYIEIAQLDPIQMDILRQKQAGKKNKEVADFINQKYHRTYTPNYISTLFRQKIIKAINAAAAYHERIVENLCFEENFKRCSSCGSLLLIDERNFIHRSRSKDGFSNRCKLCDREERKRR